MTNTNVNQDVCPTTHTTNDQAKKAASSINKIANQPSKITPPRQSAKKRTINTDGAITPPPKKKLYQPTSTERNSSPIHRSKVEIKRQLKPYLQNPITGIWRSDWWEFCFDESDYKTCDRLVQRRLDEIAASRAAMTIEVEDLLTVDDKNSKPAAKQNNKDLKQI